MGIGNGASGRCTSFREELDIVDVPQYFVDDAVIAASRGFRRRFIPADKHPTPVLEQTLPCEFDNLGPVSVIYDDSHAGYRMWYVSRERGESRLHSAVSTNGIDWDKPATGKDGSNVNRFDDGSPCTDGCVVFLDPYEPNPARRYKLIYYLPNYYLAYSPDGTTWSPAQADPVWPNGAGDGLEETHFFLRDERRRLYRGYMRVWQRHQTVRTLALGESEDLINWSGPQIIWHAGPEFGVGAQIYGMNVIADDGVYWGIPWIFYTSEPLDPRQRQTLQLKLAFSRDGRVWTAVSPEDELVPLGRPGDFDSEMMTTQCPVVKCGNKWRLYYIGAGAKHDHGGQYQASIGLAEMGPGRFVSLQADDAGSLLTKRFLFKGDRLLINARTAPGGSVVAELLNDSGDLIDGCTMENSDRFTGDATAHPLAWAGRSDLSAFTGQFLMLRLRAEKGELFSFRAGGSAELFTRKQGPPPVRCGRCTELPRIDGVLDDTCWQDFGNTGIADEFVCFERVQAPNVQTRVSVTRDDTNLYVAVDCEEPFVDRLRVEREEGEDGFTFNSDDTIELRLNGPGHGTFFHQLCVNAAGKRFHAFFSVDEGGSRIMPTIEWQAAVSTVSGHWYLEMAVPFAALTATPPEPGEKWRFNIIRYRHTDGQDVSCWSCMFGKSHRNDLSGMLVFT